MFVFEGASVHDLVQPIQRLLGNGPPWGLSLSFGFGGGAGPGDELAGAPGAALRSSSPAARQLRQALQSAQRTDGAAFWKAQLLSTAGTLVQYGGVLSAVASVMSPQGPGCCDHNGRERTANLLTSLPYAWIGVHGIRHRKSARGRAWGVSMLGVSAGSLTFHASRGRWRSLGRKVDYWCIAASSALLTRALYPNQPTAATVASLIATPFRPFFISSLHTMALELSFLQRALQEPSIRPAQRLHSAAGLAGVALFAVEDSVPHIPLVHCAWHLCSALATNSVHALLRDVEERADGGGALKPAGAGAAAAAAVGREFEVLPLQLAP